MYLSTDAMQDQIKMITDTPMHICILGAEKSVHIKRWVSGLRSLGHKIDLITLHKDSNEDIGGISLGAGNKATYLTKIWKLREIVKKINPEILHAHHVSSYGVLMGFVYHPRKILSVWGDDVIEFPYRNFVYKILARKALNSKITITATSEFLRHAALKLNPNIKNPSVIPFGIDFKEFVYLDRVPTSKIKIGIAKWLTFKYGIDILIKAFAILRSEGFDIELLIAGNGPDEAKFRKMAEDFGLADRIKFWGFLPHAKIPGFLASIDIFVMPSISDGESFGVAALEASATGLPVVASRVGGVPEVIQDNVTGILIERKNIIQLADAIRRLVNDPKLRKTMGVAGRHFVVNNYKWEDNLKSMENLYHEVIEAR